MKILIAEDDYVSRQFLMKFLGKYGDCDATIDGMEAIEVFMMRLDEEEYYDVVFLDIMMPKVDGLRALKTMKKLEKERGLASHHRAKFIMTTALNDVDKVEEAFASGSAIYAVKPLNTEKLIKLLNRVGLTLNTQGSESR